MFYEQGKYSRVIKNQLSGLVLFRNFCDQKINHNIARQLGVLPGFKLAEEHTINTKFDPVVILSAEIVENSRFRVFTNYLSDSDLVCPKSLQKVYC